MNRSIISCVLVTIGGLLVASVDAAVLKYDPNRQGDARAGGPYTVGSLVRVGATDMVITHLGAQDADAADDTHDPDGADGLTGFADDDGFRGGSTDVGLWTADGSTQLATVQVTDADPYIGAWRYAPIASGPITLAANTDYLIGTTVGSDIEWFLDSDTGGFPNPPFAGDDGFTLVENRFAVGGTLAAPTNDGTGTVGRWAPANAMEIPEPPATALFTYDTTQQALPRAEGPYTIGSLFKVGSEDRWISHLGAQDVDPANDPQDPDGPDAMTGFADGDGFFVGPIDVGIWAIDGTPLASVSVTSDDLLLNSWRYAPIADGPILLSADTEYLIGAVVGAGIEWFLDGDTTLTTPFAGNTGITMLESRFFGGSTLTAPSGLGGGDPGRWAAANAMFLAEPKPVPEPSTWVLAVLGLIGLGWTRFRRLGKASSLKG